MVTPRLVVTDPAPLRGTVLELDSPRLTLGRNERSDLRVAEPLVSGVHARFEHDGSRTTVADLDSTNGTTVNGAPVRGQARELRDGDVLRFANVEARFEQAGGPQAAPAGGYQIGGQWAGSINNVEGAQYNYIRQVTEQRESFLREVAATRTKARRLIWIGFFLFVIGASTYFWVVASTATKISRIISTPLEPDSFAQPDLPEFFGGDVAGVPLGLVGFGVAAAGILMMAVGLVLHVVAASRRKRLETAPLPWPAFPPPSQAAW